MDILLYVCLLQTEQTLYFVVELAKKKRQRIIKTWTMPIIVNLDVVMAKRKMPSNELAEKIGITPANLSILKTNKGKAIRFSTLNKLCEVLNCEPGDILEYKKDE